jgi:hypothetical protein
MIKVNATENQKMACYFGKKYLELSLSIQGIDESEASLLSKENTAGITDKYLDMYIRLCNKTAALEQEAAASSSEKIDELPDESDESIEIAGQDAANDEL